MAIVINGSGTVTGLAVGGLPDGTVDAGTLATDSVTEAKIATDSVTTTKIPAALENTFVSGRRNIVNNGAMQVAQRGTSSTSTGYGSVDRWRMAGSVTCEQSQLALTSGDAYDAGFRYAFKTTNQSAVTDTAAGYVSCFQYIEAQDLATSGWDYTDASSYITISFWVKSSVAGTYYVNPMTQDGTSKIYPQSFSLSADTWTKVEKSFPGHADLTFNNDNGRGISLHLSPYYGTNFTSGVSTSAWSTYASGDRFPDFAQNWAASADATWEITGVQLELGSTATDFEHRSFGEELALCQRYYYKFNSGRTLMINNGNGTAIMGNIYTPVDFRSSPTLTATANGSSTGSFAIQTGGSGTQVGHTAYANNVALAIPGVHCLGLNITSMSGFPDGYSGWHDFNDAALVLQLDAEL